MSIISDRAQHLAEAIKNTSEYINLKKARNIIYSNPNLKNKVEDFKKKEQALITSEMPRKDAEYKTAELSRIFEEMSKIPEINSYLRYEKEFSMLIQNAYKIVDSSIDQGIRQR